MQVNLSSTLSLLKSPLALGGQPAKPVFNDNLQVDTFTMSPRFGAGKPKPKVSLPELANTMDATEFFDAFEPLPFQSGFTAMMDKAVKNIGTTVKATPKAKLADTSAASVGRFTLGLIEVLCAISKDVESMQEERKMLDPEELKALELLENMMPAEARQRRFKGEALHRVLFTQYEKLDKQLAEQAKQEQPAPEKTSDKGIPMTVEVGDVKKKATVHFTPTLKRLLTGFVQQHESALDRTLPAFFKYVQQLEGQPGVPKEISDLSVTIKELNSSITKAVQLGTITKALELNSPEGFRTKLAELWNTEVPVEQRLMSEVQYAAVDRLIETMERAHPGDPSREVVLSQLNTLLYKLPWHKSEEKDYAKGDIQKALDDDHYGLQEVKSEVVTYAGRDLHLKKLKKLGIQPKNDGEPTIICLVGPPGVGKTSIGKSIARATGRSFTRIALGGVSDEAEIRGHRSTYIGAVPGKIVNGMIQAKSTNPVFMLDEIDKLSSSGKGDPAAALLEVLDPEQNNSFTDNFLGIPIDLSDSMFLCTANSLETIPPALRDRMQIIELKGYTGEEKIQIAQRHLLPKAREGNGLDKATLGLEEEPFNVSEAELTQIIEGYAPERGVRVMKKCLNTLAAKTASILSDLSGAPTLADFPLASPTRLKDMLGRPKYRLKQMDPTPKVGRVHGMYFSEGARSGGSMALDVVVNVEKLDRKGSRSGLVLERVSGNMAKVMDESAKRAFDFVKINAARLGIQGLDKNRTEVYIASSDQGDKDGPSAGTALTLALISRLTNRPLRGDMAMTGAFDQTGAVLEIGGVREKVTGSIEEGAKVILVPKANEDDLEDIPESVKKKATIHIVDTIDDVMKIAFADAEPSATPAVKK